jgi:uncharacterized membrane-anchored protein
VQHARSALASRQGEKPVARKLQQHPLRYALANELHARPFQAMAAPGRLVHLAFKRPEGAAERDTAADRAHLAAFLDRHGAPHPAPEAGHFVHDFGRFRLTWESHTEFVAYTLFEAGETDALFEGRLVEIFPEDWLAAAPGLVVSAVELEFLVVPDAAAAERLIEGPLKRIFTLESLAMAQLLDGGAHGFGDFRITSDGFVRFAVAVYGQVGARRIGRLAQRLIEVETYRTMAMLGLPAARDAARRLNEIERELTRLIALVAEQSDTAPKGAAEGAILAELTALAAELETLAARTAFRFGAGRAYEALVGQRLAALREERLPGRQTFAEFMARRFDPAMRTVHAAERRMQELAVRAGRIAELLSTRVNVAVESQNQRLLESMDRRAALQLRLQETVEGLSIVAISYYAISLAGYFLAPIAYAGRFTKETMTAIVAVPIVLIVFGMVRRVRRHVTGG